MKQQQELDIKITPGSNGGFVVKWYKTMPSGLQQLTGVKPEIEQLAFATAKDFVDWLVKQ